MGGEDTPERAAPERASDYHFGGDRVKEVLYDSEVILRLVDDQLQELCEKPASHLNCPSASELFSEPADHAASDWPGMRGLHQELNAT